MKRQRNYFQLKKQEKSPQRINDEAEITSVLDKWVQKSGNENANEIQPYYQYKCRSLQKGTRNYKDEQIKNTKFNFWDKNSKKFLDC